MKNIKRKLHVVLNNPVALQRFARDISFTLELSDDSARSLLNRIIRDTAKPQSKTLDAIVQAYIRINNDTRPDMEIAYELMTPIDSTP